MPVSSLALLRRLERLKTEYGGASARAKLDLLVPLARAVLPRPAHVARLHEVLCFLRAYPDDAALLARIERMLAGFARRRDLRQHGLALADSGIAGTAIHFRFFAPQASWLAERWGGRLRIDWKGFRQRARLERWLPLLTLYSETPALDEYAFDARAWVRRLKGPRETDAVFLIRRVHALRMDGFAREKLYDELDPPIVLAPGPGTPSRTHARHWPAPRAPQPAALSSRPGNPSAITDSIAYQTQPLARARPDLRAELRRPPLGVRRVTPREARVLIDLACAAMVTRSRDLDIFSWAEERDVRLVDCGDGLQFACMSAVPERRLLLEAVYGFLTLKNGVPIGYVLASALFGSSEIAYNVFETYRGAEAARVYGRVLGMAAHLFGSDAFAIDPYQLGRGNDEALASGAWWFYQKMGFRPRQRAALRRMRAELQRMQANPRHRSSRATLGALAESPLFLFAGRPRSDVLGLLSLADVGLHIVRSLAARFGADRERAESTCAEEAGALLGVRSLRGFSAAERLAWRRWGPLIGVLPGLERWSAHDKRALVAVVKAKGGASENDFVRLFDRHRRLREALRRLAATPVP